MSTVQKIKNYLPYLNEKQLEILFDIILSWQNNAATPIETNEKIIEEIYSETIEKIENPFINLSNEELLEEYGPLFYNFKGENSPNDIEINYQNSDKKISIENLTDQEEDISGNKFISQQKINSFNDDFDPLFPNNNFDTLSKNIKSKYEDLDFSTLISKKPK